MQRNESMNMEMQPDTVAKAAECAAVRRPVVRSERREDGIGVTLEMPGVAPGDVEVSCEGRKLVVRGQRTSSASGGAMVTLHREIQGGSFEAVLDLPEGIAADRIEADMRAGLLSLSLPMRAPGRLTIPVRGE